jgi:NAD(P)-dependent dehydrogenase (short-subunit alcohol dehydrogenase family)
VTVEPSADRGQPGPAGVAGTPRPLVGRRVLVTGGGRGLGLATARRLAVEGATVVVGEVDVGRGQAAEKLLRADGLDVTFVEMDVGDPSSVSRGVELVEQAGPLWGLVNNAALADAVGGRLVHEITVEEWDRLMTVNARGPWLVARAVVPGMLRSGGGRIVNIASDAALFGSPRLAHYVASKGAVIALTRAMARDLGRDGITVNAVAPGLTLGESTERIPTERHELYRQLRALDRPQEHDDTVGAIAFLLGPDAAYITGQLLVVDGGWVMH